jgi:hypothetical protein
MMMHISSLRILLVQLTETKPFAQNS